jgi:hypothetical protein
MWIKGRKYEVRYMNKKYNRKPARRLTSNEAWYAIFIGCCIAGVAMYVVYGIILLLRFIGGLIF